MALESVGRFDRMLTTRTKAKWLNDYSQLQPNLPSSKNAASMFHEKWKISQQQQKKQAKAMFFFLFVQTLQSNLFVMCVCES